MSSLCQMIVSDDPVAGPVVFDPTMAKLAERAEAYRKAGVDVLMLSPRNFEQFEKRTVGRS